MISSAVTLGCFGEEEEAAARREAEEEEAAAWGTGRRKALLFGRAAESRSAETVTNLMLLCKSLCYLCVSVCVCV